MDKHQIPKKSLGQHFLMHASIAERMVDAATLSPEDIVLEIGPGKGILTRVLLERVSKVIAVETDRELAQFLKNEFKEELVSSKLELIEEDIRAFDFSLLPTSYKVVANIPYYLTGDIMRQFLSADKQPSSMTLLVQKEVAIRIARVKKESILSLSVKVYGTPRYVFTVPRGAFVPAPKVDSAVLHIRDISRAAFSTGAEEKLFFELVKAGFRHKRKLLVNNLGDFDLNKVSITPGARAEDLSLANWLTIAKSLVH